jgi:hypothetical protein
VLLSPRRAIDDALERAASSNRRTVSLTDSGDGPGDEVVKRQGSSAALAVAAAAAEMEKRSGHAAAAPGALVEATGAPLASDADPATLCKALLLGRHAALADHFAAMSSDAERAATTNKMRELLDEMRAAHERRICVAQCAVRRWLARRKLQWRRNARRQRWDVVNELLRTELTYVKGLSVLAFRYYEPLAAAVADKSAGLLNETDLRTVLGELSVTDLHAANVTLRDELQACVSQWTHWSSVGDVLTTHLLRFREVYSNYYANFDASNELLGKRLRTHDKFRLFCEQVQADPECERLDLVSYLITPIQRLPRYALLIDQLIAATPPDHPDSDPLTRAVVVARALITRINRHMQCRAQLLRWGADLGARGPQPLCSPLRFVVSRTDAKLATKDDKATDVVLAVLSDHVLIMHSKVKHRVVLPLHVCWARRAGATDADAELELLSSAGAHVLRFASAERRDAVWTDLVDALSTLLDARLSGELAAAPERAAIDALLHVFVHSRRPSSRADVDAFDDEVAASSRRRIHDTERQVLVLRFGQKAVKQQERAAPLLTRTMSISNALSPRAATATVGRPASGAPALSRTSSVTALTIKPTASNSPLSPRARLAAAANTPERGSPALSRRPTKEPTTLSAPIEARRQSTLLPPPSAGGPQKLMAVALYSFAPQRAGDLALTKGDIIDAIEVTPSGWWKGQIAGSEARGVFPATYCRPINFVLPPEQKQQLDLIAKSGAGSVAPASSPAPGAIVVTTLLPAASQPQQQASLSTPAPSVVRSVSPTNVTPAQPVKTGSLRGGDVKALPSAPLPTRAAPIKPTAAVPRTLAPPQATAAPLVKKLPTLPPAVQATNSGQVSPSQNLRTVLRTGTLLTDDEMESAPTILRAGALLTDDELMLLDAPANLRPTEDDGV